MGVNEEGRTEYLQEELHSIHPELLQSHYLYHVVAVFSREEPKDAKR